MPPPPDSGSSQLPNAPVTSLLVLTAMPLEARALARRLGLPRVAPSAWPHYRSDRLEIAAVGLGAIHLRERAAALRPPWLVVSSGTCGALAARLAAGDLVVPALVRDGVRSRRTASLPPLVSEGVLVTAPAVVAAPADKWRLRAQTGALAVDLESAAILDWAQAIGVPAAVVRGVSDTADTPIPDDLLAILTPDGTIPAVRLALLLARRPRLWRRARALAQGAAAALDAVSRALRAVAEAHHRAAPIRIAAPDAADDAAVTSGGGPVVPPSRVHRRRVRGRQPSKAGS